MSAPWRRVITAQDVESAAYAGQKELAYDEQTSIVTPLAASRANDLGVALRARKAGAAVPSPERQPPDAAAAAGDGEALKSLRPELAAEVLRRVQRRLDE